MSPEAGLRLGTTSYIIPADILPNIRFLAGQVQDVELVLFEVDDGPNNLPGPQEIAKMGRLADTNKMSYTVHLPLDLRLASGSGEQHISLLKVRKVIESTHALRPWAYVLHLDGHEFIDNPDAAGLARWQVEAVRALELVAAWAGSPELLAVENLDGYPPEFWTPVLEQIPVSRCIDIGHLWKDGFDPLPFLDRHLARARVLHIHGIGTRDHQSLANQSPAQLDAVFRLLLRRKFNGVVTLEVFGEDDFRSSLAALNQSLDRIEKK